ncbi:ankyrin repeat domain-containing protein [Amycolatopsis sp. FDAARGOS 1241]|uniref:ankyrin repeat domain-containing protein n=1 Tax=Amycolatopsis sp. FDAARGOS 1241 TaxID=2778070 RepID=UPI001EF337F6|nr:ankyrin repeat domain-containing protein [Amycolatopsis sp. FDAARGOS 1241]
MGPRLWLRCSGATGRWRKSWRGTGKPRATSASPRASGTRSCSTSSSVRTGHSRRRRARIASSTGPQRFPVLAPVRRPGRIRDEALSWAARNDRTEALRTLAARGANLDADVYRGTALSWAAAQGKVTAVRTLLELGADVNRVGTFGGPKHGVGITALHLAAQNNHLDVLEVLIAAPVPTATRATASGTPRPRAGPRRATARRRANSWREPGSPVDKRSP